MLSMVGVGASWCMNIDDAAAVMLMLIDSEDIVMTLFSDFRADDDGELIIRKYFIHDDWLRKIRDLLMAGQTCKWEMRGASID